MKFDIRTKLVIAICVNILSFVTQNSICLLMYLLIVVLLTNRSTQETYNLIKKCRWLFLLIAMMFVIQVTFIKTGHEIYTISGLKIITTGGLNVARLVALRLLVIVFSGLYLSLDRISDYMRVFTIIRIPFIVSLMVMIAVNTVPLIKRESRIVYNAMVSRGSFFNGAMLANRIAGFARISMNVLIGIIAKSKIMTEAIESRGMTLSNKRTSLKTFTLRWFDLVAMVAFPIVFGFILIGFK